MIETNLHPESVQPPKALHPWGCSCTSCNGERARLDECVWVLRENGELR